MKRMMSVLLQVKEVRVESEDNRELFLAFRWISGVCFGIEFLWNHNIMVIDLGIGRIYLGIRERL